MAEFLLISDRDDFQFELMSDSTESIDELLYDNALARPISRISLDDDGKSNNSFSDTSTPRDTVIGVNIGMKGSESNDKIIEAKVEDKVDDLLSIKSLRLDSDETSEYDNTEHFIHVNFVPEFNFYTRSKRYKNGTRKSLTFTNDRMRDIERENKILLQKILSKGPNCKSANKPAPLPDYHNRAASSALNRRKQQRQIDYENQILKRKIESISCRRKREY